MLKNIKCYAIVINGNEKSEYYHQYCKGSWEDGLNVKVEKFNAVTPDTLKRHKELTFARYSSAPKYISKGLKIEISPTEKACFYSHFKLWEMSALSFEPILILEHDAFLESPKNFWYDENYDIIFYDKAAMGSYVIQPHFARDLIEYLYSKEISYGPYSHIYSFGVETNRSSKIVNDKHPMYRVASNQVMSRKYGNTIDHFSNGKKEYRQHEFIMID